MKALKVKLKNFGAYSHFEAEFSDGNVYIIGSNGAGKSTLIKSFLGGLKGIGENQGGLVGERWQFIGGVGKTADIEWTLRDEVRGIDVVIRNHITKTGNDISFKAPEGSNLDKEWLENLFSVALMSSKQFCSHSPQEQAALLGINTEKFDNEIVALKDEFTLLNRDLSNFGELGDEPERVDEVKIDELSGELDDLIVKQADYESVKNDVEELKDEKAEAERAIIELEEKLKTAKEDFKAGEQSFKEKDAAFKNMQDPTEAIETVKEKIRTSQETNTKHTTWKTWTEKTDKKTIAQEFVDENKKLQKDQVTLKIDYMKTFKFPLKNMGVDDKGGLTLKDRHINENGYSQGELEVIIAKIAVYLNPELRFRMIDDASLLDPKKKSAIQKQLEKEGFQVLWFLVDDKKIDSNSILLKECKQVESYDESDDLI